MQKKALVKHEFAEINAYLFIEELQERIYSQYPKIIAVGEEESLGGSRMYISEICQKYNTPQNIKPDKISHEEVKLNFEKDNNSPDAKQPIADPQQKKVDDLALKLKQNMVQTKILNEEQKVFYSEN